MNKHIKITIIAALLSSAILMNCKKAEDDSALFALLGINGSSGPACIDGGTCKIFYTATPAQGNVGISGADALCNNDANKPAGSSTYKAMIVANGIRQACAVDNCGGDGTGEHTDWVLKPATKYVKSDGTTELFTTDINGVFVWGTLVNSLDTATIEFYTGLTSTWTNSGNDCSKWTSNANVSAQSGGKAPNTDSFLVSGINLNCALAEQFLCVEQ